MAYIKRLVVFLLFLLPAFSWAGYAQLTPPPSWSAGTGAVVGAGGAFNASQAVAANAATLSAEGTVLTNASLNVAGRNVTMPAVLRFAANAPRYAASAVFLNPYARFALGVAAWIGVDFFYDEIKKAWYKIDDTKPISDGFYYYANSVPYVAPSNKYQTYTQLCNEALSSFFVASPHVSWSIQECSYSSGGGVLRIHGQAKDNPSAVYNYTYGFSRSPSTGTV